MVSAAAADPDWPTQEFCEALSGTSIATPHYRGLSPRQAQNQHQARENASGRSPPSIKGGRRVGGPSMPERWTRVMTSPITEAAAVLGWPFFYGLGRGSR